MELAFNVAWGPLTQIAIPFIDIRSAVELAAGAYGWWKARERSLSLIEMIHASGGRLAPSTTFNMSLYYAARQTSSVRGIAWYDGRLESFPLPRASTGSLGDSGLVCLRALTTALLALYDVESVSAVLTHIIPNQLINYDLEGESLVADGPFQACVRHFVHAVAAEEQSNTLRKDLWRRVDKEFDQAFPISKGRYCVTDVQEIEVPIVIGFLDWILTPPSKRDIHCYPTRSLTVWSVAIMLSHLGFEVVSSPIIISSCEVYNQEIHNGVVSFPEKVFLVTLNFSKTDHFAPTPGCLRTTQTSAAPRIVPVKSIPAIIFRHIRCTNQITSVEQLCAIWDTAFNHAYFAFGPIKLGSGAFVHLPIVNPKGTTTKFGDHPLFHILASQLSDCLPDHAWTITKVKLYLENYCVKEDGDKDPSHTSDGMPGSPYLETQEWYIFSALLLATLYAACSKSLCLVSDTVTAAALVEVAVDSNLLSNPHKIVDLNAWFSVLERATDIGGVSMDEWVALVVTTFTGQQRESTEDRNSQFFGCHLNGIFLIADFLMQPSVRRESVVQYHIQYGRPLQVPLTEHEFVDPYGGSIIHRRSERFVFPDFPATTTPASYTPSPTVRIDLEPHWEGNPRQVIFRVRIEGILKYSFSPFKLYEIFYGRNMSFVDCYCSTPVTQMSLANSPSWKSIDIAQLVNIVDSMPQANTDLIIDAAEEMSVCIHTCGDDASQVLSLVLWDRRTFFSSRCLSCAHTRFRNYQLGSKAKGVLLIDGVKV